MVTLILSLFLFGLFAFENVERGRILEWLEARPWYVSFPIGLGLVLLVMISIARGINSVFHILKFGNG